MDIKTVCCTKKNTVLKEKKNPVRPVMVNEVQPVLRQAKRGQDEGSELREKFTELRG